jgi:hypothetical protein
MPPAANGPDLMVKNPTRIGPVSAAKVGETTNQLNPKLQVIATKNRQKILIDFISIPLYFLS